jgi:hypothetical protein
MRGLRYLAATAAITGLLTGPAVTAASAATSQGAAAGAAAGVSLRGGTGAICQPLPASTPGSSREN